MVLEVVFLNSTLSNQREDMSHDTGYDGIRSLKS